MRVAAEPMGPGQRHDRGASADQAPYPGGHEEQSCLACTPDEHCSVDMVEGLLHAVHEQRHEGQHGPYWTGTLVLRPPGSKARIWVDIGGQWGRLIHDLALLSSRWAPGETSDPPAVRCYHLERRADERRQRLCALPGSLIVLEPDRLVDVSRLEGAGYCLRQWLAGQLTRDEHNEAMVRGTIVHACLQHQASTGRAAADGLEGALRAQTLSLAAIERTEADLTMAVEPHLTRLDLWFRAQGQARLGPHEETSGQVRSETLLLCPELGLRGRIDLAVMSPPDQGPAAGPAPLVAALIELKTGKANPQFPDPQFQVQGYHAILHAQGRRAADQEAWVVYTGALAYDIQRVTFSPQALRDVVQRRNLVVLAERWDHAPISGTERQCARAGRREACRDVGYLLDLGPCQGCRNGDAVGPFGAHDRDFYARYYKLLRRESAEGARALHTLWRQPPDERVSAGSAVWVASTGDGPQRIEGTARWLYTLSCRNRSELRPGDRVLLSDGDPVRGEVVGATVQQVADGALVVSAADQLAGAPRLVDRYETPEAVERALSTLYTWLAQTTPEQRTLLYGTRGPTFGPVAQDAVSSVALNSDQADALRRALTMRDYLLIQGPPGTGKTTVIAAIVVALVASGQRVLLSAWTNRAVDTMLQGLLAVGFTRFARLGSPVAVDPTIRDGYLVGFASAGTLPGAEEVGRVLATTPVLAATAATWADGRYRRAQVGCDVAIVDEAAQVTVPAILGPLRLARRFVLVGDDCQLPAVVVCPEIRDELGCSLFERLRPVAEAHGALVTLREQYRMNAVLCAFPSAAFYHGRLQAHSSVVARRMPSNEGCLEGDTRLRRIADPAQPLVLVNVRRPAGPSTGRDNDHEAGAVASIVQLLSARGVPAAQIGVIAPYRAQVALIRRRLEALNIACGTDGAVSVDTVDRFQGSEREVIVLSLVSGSPRQGVRASQHVEFLSDARRLNVALTRARGKLLVVGDVRTLSWLPVVRDLVAHCHATGCIVRWPAHDAPGPLQAPDTL